MTDVLINQNINFGYWLRAAGLALLAVLLQESGAAAQDAGAGAAPATGISGYMDFHFNKPTDQAGELDFHRFVLLVTHRFSDRIRFVSELELEHAFVEGLEEAGELELEQAYLDFLRHPELQRPRRHAADAGRHHQRAARAADLLRRRAAAGRHGDRPDARGSRSAPGCTARSAAAGATGCS